MPKKGFRLSEETKRKIGQTRKGKYKGKEHPFFGKKHTEELKRKLSAARTGTKLSEETKRKISEASVHQVFPQVDSKAEKYLQKLLDEIGITYSKHKAILGQPDIFINPNICIFVDGDYWHANPNPHIESGQKRSGFKFDDKIRGGVYAEDKWARDERITKTLEERGYIVLRFYVSKIQKNPKKCLQKILKARKK